MNEIWDMKYENKDAVILIVPPDGQEWHEVRPVVCKENLILDLHVFWYQFWDGFDQNFQNCEGKKRKIWKMVFFACTYFNIVFYENNPH